MWIWEWRCCGNLWELIASRRMDRLIPDRLHDVKCPTCGNVPTKKLVRINR